MLSLVKTLPHVVFELNDFGNEMLLEGPLSVRLPDGGLSLLNNCTLEEPNRLQDIDAKLCLELGPEATRASHSLFLLKGELVVEIERISKGDTLQIASSLTDKHPWGNVEDVHNLIDFIGFRLHHLRLLSHVSVSVLKPRRHRPSAKHLGARRWFLSFRKVLRSISYTIWLLVAEVEVRKRVFVEPLHKGQVL